MKRMMRMRRGMRQSMAERVVHVEDSSPLRMRKTFDQDKCLEHGARIKSDAFIEHHKRLIVDL